MGFAGKARQGEWFPVTFEIFNDGPTFDGQVELRPSFGDNPVYSYNVELATNTRKRFTLAVFADTNASWSAKLKNGRKTVSKNDELKLDSFDSTVVLVGALSGQQAGGPVLPKTRFKSKWDNDRFAPRVGHLQLDTFPDDPIALSGLNALYLNSARAINLRTEQAAAPLDVGARRRASDFGGGPARRCHQHTVAGEPHSRSVWPCAKLRRWPGAASLGRDRRRQRPHSSSLAAAWRIPGRPQPRRHFCRRPTRHRRSAPGQGRGALRARQPAGRRRGQSRALAK